MGKSITISDLEKHFIARADRGASVDSILTEFASMIKAKFIKFNYRNPDSYGVLITSSMWINLFYSSQKRTFGFQCFHLDGTLQSVLSLQHSTSSILDVILRLAGNMGNFTEENDDSSSYDDDSYDSDDDSC
jgi:hypothetical protein